MTIYLSTQTPHYTADIMDVVRLFFGMAECVLSDANSATLLHHFIETEDKWITDFAYQAHTASASCKRSGTTAIEMKRHQKRLIKQTLYDLLKQISGIHPPWGSMTGIRPTRLFYEQLEQGSNDEEAQTALQTRFDVRADKTALLKQIIQVQRTLPAPDAMQADVYIAIPFCVTQCSFCSFSSGELGDGKLVEPYLAALFHEMLKTKQLIDQLGMGLRALYVGGGTPTSLNNSAFEAFIHKTISLFGKAGEITVEAGRADTITKEKLLAMRDNRVGRISINPQTMNDETLERIGRKHTAEDVYRAYEWAREAGLKHINMDVIAGLPGETVDDFANTMNAIRSFAPESLTVHTLAMKRTSKLSLMNASLPDGAVTGEMVRMGAQTAQSLGLSPYYLYRQKYMAGNQENVGYAGAGHACVYNVDMMEETTHIFGIGAGAISKRIMGEEMRIARAPNVSDITSYIQRVDEMLERKKMLWNRE